MVAASEMYSLKEVAERFRQDKRTITRWEQAGKFPKRLNWPGQVRYDRAEVDAWFVQLHEKAKAG